LTRHLATQRYLDGWTTVAGLVLAPVVAAWANCERFTWNGDLAGRTARLWLIAIAAGLGVGVVAIAGGSAMALSLVAAGGIVAVGVQRISSGRSSSSDTEAISANRGPPAAGVGHAGRKVRRQESEAQAGETARDVTSGHRTHPSGAAFRLAAWMLAAWFVGLLAATPCYHPYPRLALPWLTACWLAAGAVIGRFLDRPFAAPQATSGPGRRRLVAVVLLLSLSLYPIASWRGPPFVPPRWTAWRDRAGLQRVATDLLRDAARTTRELGPSGHPDLDAVIYVYAEPGLFFQLESVPDDSGLKFVASPATSLALQKPLEVTVFLATGPHADRMGVAQDPAVRQYRLVASYPWQPSDLVALDEYPAAQLQKDRGARTEEIRLYLVHSPSATR